MLLGRRLRCIVDSWVVHCRQLHEWIQPEGRDTGIKVYNSLTSSKVPLILPGSKLATWYMCGPTVYDVAHLGHASCYVKFDIMRRILSNIFGIDVVMVMGITDIDDKIVQRAKQTGVNYRQITQKYEKQFIEDISALNVLPPTKIARVTDHIDCIIQFIEQIIQNDYAYVTDAGNVYFHIQNFGDRYGKLSPARQTVHVPLPEVTETDKMDKRDFALWKASRTGEPFWHSPWGTGRPGWHIECSAMSSAMFGDQLDIHTGGIDLLFPHHENEIVQCEAHHQVDQWANYFMHTGHMYVSKEKMSKSLQNYVAIKDYLKEKTSDQFRMLCLLSKYRNAMEYNSDIFTRAETELRKFKSYLGDAKAYVDGSIESAIANESEILEKLAITKTQVRTALEDDFDTPAAIKHMLQLMSFANVHASPSNRISKYTTSRSPSVIAAVAAFIQRMLFCFGISLDHNRMINVGSADSVLEPLVKFRSMIRQYTLDKLKNKRDLPVQYHSHVNQESAFLLKACDDLRQDLLNVGISVKDHAKGSSWEFSTEDPL